MGAAKSSTSKPWILESDSKEEWIRWKERFSKYYNDKIPQTQTAKFYHYTGFVGQEILKKIYFGDIKNEITIATLIFKFDVYFNFQGVVRYEYESVDKYIARLAWCSVKLFGGHDFQDIVKEKILQDWKSEHIFDQLLTLPAYNSRNRNFETSSVDELARIWNYVESVNGNHQVPQATEQNTQNLNTQYNKTGLQSSSKKDNLDAGAENNSESRIPIKSIEISDHSKGHGYDSLFGSYLVDEVTSIRIEEPYLMEFYQIQNFLRFCELALKRCRYLSRINVRTKRDPNDETTQIKRFDELRASLAGNRVYLEIEYSETIHDRQIILSTGYIIKIGRGLHYFQKHGGNLAVGFFDLDLRPCRETRVDISQRQST